MNAPLTCAAPIRRRLRIVTRCATLDEFIALYGQRTDQSSLVVGVRSPAAVGARREFSVLLRDGTMVMSGIADVSLADGVIGEPRGLRLEFRELDALSAAIHDSILDAQFADEPTCVWQPEGEGPVDSFVPALELEDLRGEIEASHPHCVTPRPVLVSPVWQTEPGRALTTGDDDQGPADWVRPPPLQRLAATALCGLLVGCAVWSMQLPSLAAGLGERDATASVEPPPAVPATIVLPSLPALPPALAARAEELPPPPCVASVTSKTPGAAVSWNDAYIGKTPLVAVEVPCGPATVAVRRRGYHTGRTRVEAVAGEAVEVEQKLERKRARSSRRTSAARTASKRTANKDDDKPHILRPRPRTSTRRSK